MSNPKQELTKEDKIKALAFTGVAVALVIGWLIFGSNNPSDRRISVNKALVSSRQFVEQRLKSPGSAKFDDLTHNCTQLNDTSFMIKSFVDAQNSFGALIRSNYMCKIIYHPTTDKIFCEDLIIQ